MLQIASRYPSLGTVYDIEIVGFICGDGISFRFVLKSKLVP